MADLDQGPSTSTGGGRLVLVVALLLAVAGGVTWDRVYRLEARAASPPVPADRLLLLVEGGGAAPRETPAPPRTRARPAPARPGSASAAAPSSTEERSGLWRVARGDSLYTIASRALGSSARWREIADLNGLKPPYRIEVGQDLRLP